MPQAIYKGSHASLRNVLRQLPGIAAGRLPDPTGIVQNIQLRAGLAAQSRIRDDFVIKSKRGTGTDGISWPYLSKKYLAYGRRVSGNEKKELGTTGARVRGLLTKEQDKVWRITFFINYKRLLKAHYGDAQAKELAARIAWAKVKRMGAQTKLDVYGNREYLEILRDTGIMLSLLSPAVSGSVPIDASGGYGPGLNYQIFEIEAGKVRVGIGGPKAKHHLGDPSKGLPQRALWPTGSVGSFSPEWWAPIVRATLGSVVEVVKKLVSR